MAPSGIPWDTNFHPKGWGCFRLAKYQGSLRTRAETLAAQAKYRLGWKDILMVYSLVALEAHSLYQKQSVKTFTHSLVLA